MKSLSGLARMTKEELMSALDEIDGMGTPSGWSGELKTMLFKQLCQKDPESALARFADPSRSDRSEMIRTLTNWRGAVIRKQDVAIAKNYLSEQGEFFKVIGHLNRQRVDFLKSRRLFLTPDSAGTLQMWPGKLKNKGFFPNDMA